MSWLEYGVLPAQYGNAFWPRFLSWALNLTFGLPGPLIRKKSSNALTSACGILLAGCAARMCNCGLLAKGTRLALLKNKVSDCARTGAAASNNATTASSNSLRMKFSWDGTG